ncbi:MAG: hypothetical protein NXI31_25790 [bacterium]|nr:hypothetical protein [bacterium]
MSSDPTVIGRSRLHPRALASRALLIVLFCLPMAGCNLLIDEFTWLDRVPPAAEDSPAAASEQ